MFQVDDLSEAGKAGGVAGWDGVDRRMGERRQADNERDGRERGPDRRKAQYCHACGRTFRPTPMQKRICPSCRGEAMRMGANPGRLGGAF